MRLRAGAAVALALSALLGCATWPGGDADSRPGPGAAVTSLGDTRGRYRLLVRRFCSDETCFSRAFLQKVERGPGGELAVVRTEPVREINAAPVFVKSFRALGQPGFENVFELVVAPGVHAPDERVLRLHPRAEGGYRVERLGEQPL